MQIFYRMILPRNLYLHIKVTVSPHLLQIPKEQLVMRKANYAELGILEIFKNTECRKMTFVMFFAWIATNLGMKCK